MAAAAPGAQPAHKDHIHHVEGVAHNIAQDHGSGQSQEVGEDMSLGVSGRFFLATLLVELQDLPVHKIDNLPVNFPGCLPEFFSD